MNLCTFSKSQTHEHAILPSCPLALSSSCSHKCLCKTRVYLSSRIRVMTCTYPLTWKGEEIKDEAKLAEKIRQMAGQVGKRGKKRAEAGDVGDVAKLSSDSGFDDVELEPDDFELEDDVSNELVVSEEQKVIAGRMEHLVNRAESPMQAINEMGKWLANSAMFGLSGGMVGEAQGKVLAMTAYATGKNVVSLAAEYHIMPGGLSMKAKSKLAKFRQIGGTHKILRRDSEGASVELSLDGETQVFTFTHDDAKKEPFYKKKDNTIHENYATPRKRMQMLWNRVIGDGVDTMAPEISGGLYTPEDLMDVQAEKERGPIKTPIVGKDTISCTVNAQPNATVTCTTPVPEEIEVEATVTPTTTPAPVIEVEPEPEPEPEPPAPAEAATDEQPAQATEAEAPFGDTEIEESGPPMTPAQLKELKGLCEQLNKLDKTAWQTRVLDYLGYPSAKHLTSAQADQVFVVAKEVLTLLRGSSDMEKWANDALAKN